MNESSASVSQKIFRYTKNLIMLIGLMLFFTLSAQAVNSIDSPGIIEGEQTPKFLVDNMIKKVF